MSTVLILGIMLGVFALLIVWAINSFNSLVRLRSLVSEGWSGIDVQLKRRYDLVPNLVAVVKQYSIHEKEVLENVTKMRASALSAQTISEKIDAEKGFTSALKTLFAVAENYPQLKANENFLQLQNQLSNLEHEIQLGRRYYNGAVRNYNIAVATFPRNIIAGLFRFDPVSYFEIDKEQRENPQVRF